jgi:hypothetical protein
MEDDLEADIRAAQASLVADAGDAAAAPSAGAPAPVAAAADASAPADQVSPKADDRARDETGKFKAKADEAKPAEQAKIAQPDGKAAAAAPVDPNAPKQPDITPPANWKGAGKVDWKRLPRAIQQEIAQDYTRTTDTEGKLQKLESAIGPERAQVLSATYGSVEQGLQNLFAVSDMATKNPQGFLLWFAQQRGINLAQMVGQAMQQPGGEQPQAQQADPLMQKVSQLEMMIQGFMQHQQQSATAPVLSEIERFSTDPANPYFNDVADDINTLLKGGRVPGNSPSEKLKNAYDMAVWAHPEIRKTLIESQRQSFADQQASVANNALNASSSISGSPAGAQIANQEPNETLEQTITRLVHASRS